jgi:hypothetical protein
MEANRRIVTTADAIELEEHIVTVDPVHRNALAQRCL